MGLHLLASAGVKKEWIRIRNVHQFECQISSLRKQQNQCGL